MATLFELALTLPLLALAFFWLAERRGTTKAYLILALLPTASFFLLLKFQQYLGNWPSTLLREMLWLSFDYIRFWHGSGRSRLPK
jgi:lipopolysaccharide export LptBFGC system permease protein LptF